MAPIWSKNAETRHYPEHPARRVVQRAPSADDLFYRRAEALPDRLYPAVDGVHSMQAPGYRRPSLSPGEARVRQDIAHPGESLRRLLHYHVQIPRDRSDLHAHHRERSARQSPGPETVESAVEICREAGGEFVGEEYDLLDILPEHVLYAYAVDNAADGRVHTVHRPDHAYDVVRGAYELVCRRLEHLVGHGPEPGEVPLVDFRLLLPHRAELFERIVEVLYQRGEPGGHLVRVPGEVSHLVRYAGQGLALYPGLLRDDHGVYRVYLDSLYDVYDLLDPARDLEAAFYPRHYVIRYLFIRAKNVQALCYDSLYLPLLGVNDPVQEGVILPLPLYRVKVLDMGKNHGPEIPHAQRRADQELPRIAEYGLRVVPQVLERPAYPAYGFRRHESVDG